MMDAMQANWPDLNYEEAKSTFETVHLWTQIAGKIKLSKLPWINHSWHVPLLLTPVGLTTGNLPDYNKNFQIDFDFLNHRLEITTSNNEIRVFPLKNISVADFYENIINNLRELNIHVKINTTPNELEEIIPFEKDTVHSTYKDDHIKNLHIALLKAQKVFTQFRAEFKGKCSPVHFFWGGFDLAVTRFSGREAPPHPGGIPNLPDWVAREAYSHEVSSCGFWPGNESFPEAAFYSYLYPEPPGFNKAVIKPEQAYYHQELKEFILLYADVQKAIDPMATLMDFLHSTYNAARSLAKWNDY